MIEFFEALAMLAQARYAYLVQYTTIESPDNLLIRIEGGMFRLAKTA